MIVLYNKGLLYAKVIMNLKFKMEYNGRVLDNKRQEDLLLLPEEVMHVLQRNGDLKIWNGEKYIKLNLGQFYDIMQNKRYNVIDYVEPKKEVKVEEKQQPQQPKAQPKVEVKQEEKKQEPKVQPKEEVKVEPKQEVKVEEKQQPKEEVKQDNENKKQRHNKQGGDK